MSQMHTSMEQRGGRHAKWASKKGILTLFAARWSAGLLATYEDPRVVTVRESSAEYTDVPGRARSDVTGRAVSDRVTGRADGRGAASSGTASSWARLVLPTDKRLLRMGE